MKYFILSLLFLVFASLSAFSQTIVLNEDFESAPYDLISSGTPAWGINSRLQTSGSYSDSCTVGLSSTTYLTSATFSAAGNSSVILEFKQICKIEMGDAAQIEYSNDGGTTWTTITAANYLGAGSFASNKFTEFSYPTAWQAGTATAVPQNSWWKTEQFDLSALVGNQSNVKIRFKLNDANNSGPAQRLGWYLDDVKVTIAPSELIPPSITLLPVIYQDTVQFSGPFQIKAAISDASGIDTAKLIYSLNGGLNDTLGMTVLLADTFIATIPAQAYNTHVDYTILATDASLAANTANNTGNWFFVQRPAPMVIIGTGTSSEYYLPCYGYYNYGWSAQVYSSAEIGMSGVIDSLFFYVANTTTSNMTNQRMMVAEVPDSIFNNNAMPDSASMTSFFAGDVTWGGPGWVKFTATSSFYYSGAGHLLIYWINRDGSWSNNAYPEFQYTATPVANKAKYVYSDTYSVVFPSSSGNLTTERPNLKIAFQVNNNTYDAMMFQITEPLTTPIPTTGTPYPVKAIFRNVGSDTLTSLTLSWSVDGVLQTPYPWTGSLLQDQNSAELTLGTATFTGQGNHQIKVWCELPNGVADEGPINDTLVKNYYACDNILAGTYSINPIVPTGGTNFQYFADAIDALTNCGISDTTVFEIATGVYDTLLDIPVIPGAGATANVVFTSATGNAADVLLRNNATSSADNYIFNLAGTGYFNIENLSIQATGTSYANCIVLENGCDNVIIKNNIISGIVPATQDENTDLIIVRYGNSVSNVSVLNNTLNSGSAAIDFNGNYSQYHQNIDFSGNSISGYYYAGILLQYFSGATIDTNYVSTINSDSYSHGIYLAYGENADIRMNTVYNAFYSAIYVEEVSNTASDRGNIINNFASVGGSNDAYALAIPNSTFFNVFHNSANCYGTSDYSYAFYTYYGNSNQIRDNVFAHTGNGVAVSWNYSSDTADYNNLYSNGIYLAQYDWSGYYDLASWQSVSYQDSNSVSINPLFINDRNLHTLAFSTNDLGSGVGVADDIDGDARNMTTPDMGADEFTPPQQEAGLVSVLSPVSGCDLNMESVEIRIACNGLDTIDGNLTAYYSIDGGAPVSEAVTAQILPGDTIDFTFTTQCDLSVTTTDQIFNVSAWIALTGDPIPANDTLEIFVASLHNPAPVSVSNATIPYGTMATLTGICPDTVQWYADPALNALLSTGAVFTTPVLYDTTIYYAASTSGVNYTYNFESDLQGWSALTPCSSYTTYNWDWSSDGGLGTAFMENASTTSGAVLMSPVLNVFGTDVTLSFTHRFETEGCCDHGYVAYRIDGGAWTQFKPTTGDYNASGGLSADPLMGSCGYNVPSEGTFAGTSAYMTSSGQIDLNGGTQLEIAFVFSSDGSVNYDGWYIDEVSVEKPGCPGQVVPDTVFVTGIPAVDVGAIAVDQPVSGIQLSTAETVSIRVKNYGTSAVSNIPVNYTINGGAAVTETLAGPINPGDTAVYTFTASADLSAYGTFDIAAFTTLTGDLYPVNDTAKRQVVNSPLTYCVSAADYSSDEDIGNVTLANINNTSSTPYDGTYTDYSLLVQPAYLALGQTYPISVTVVTGGGVYSGYCEVYIDFNHNGVFEEPDEVVFGSAYSTQPEVLSGTVTVPLTAVSGTTGMRVVVEESGSASATVPCGTYGWGETEDYLVTIAPQIPNDAGVVSIDSPDYIQSENSQVPVIVTVRNFGTSTLTSIPVEYVVNGGAPVSYTWTGSLASNATTQITLPDVTVLPDSNEICAYTLVVDDTNTFNDNSCAYFYGLPPSTIFEDDMENGTLLFTDAATLWEHGVPAADVINIAHSPDNVWTTNLDGDYPNSASGFVYTPTINFFGISGAYLTFYYWMDAEENSDGGYVQYSVNNGATWSSLGSINDPDGFNWFDSYVSGTPGWSVATDGWSPAFIKLDVVSGYSSVKFRFGFKSNTATVNNGFAIDDIKILGPPVAIDGGVVEIVAPAASTTPGTATSVTIKIKNFGTDTLTSIPVSYTLDTGYPPQNGTWTGTLLPDSTVNYTFTQTYPGPSINYELCSFTKITGDPYKSNDTTCVVFDDVVGIDEASLNGVTLLQNIPNPASTQTEISFTLPAPGKCVLTLRNTLGELIETTTLDGQSGKNSVNVDLCNLGQGIYVYTLEYKDVVLTRRLSVIK